MATAGDCTLDIFQPLELFEEKFPMFGGIPVERSEHWNHRCSLSGGVFKGRELRTDYADCVFGEKGYRFFFVMADLEEPVHVHVMKDNAIAKCWLNPVRVASSKGFSNHPLRGIVEIAKEHEQQIRDVWNERLRNRY